MKKLLLAVAVSSISATFATPFTGNDAQSQAMGNTGVAAAEPAAAINYNPALLATYPDENDFSMTLPSVKFYLDDQLGFAESTDEFLNVTVENYNDVDLDAYNTALNGGGSESSLTDVFADISTTVASIVTLSDDIATDAADGTIDTPANITNLQTQNDNLRDNSDALDTKILAIETQNNNVTNLSASVSDGLNDINDKPAQLGLGLDLLNVALPDRQLGLAFSVSTNATIGLSAKVSGADLSQIDDVIEDLNEFTAQSSNITSELGGVTDANDALIVVLNSQPTGTEYDGTTYASSALALAAWAGDLDDASDEVNNQTTELDTEVTALQTFTTTNGTVENGELQTLDFNSTSEVEIVGANVVDLAFAAARQFTYNGEVFSVGVTPKLQHITIFEKTILLDEAGDEGSVVSDDPVAYFTDNSTSMLRANIDFGAAKTWDYHGQIRAGFVIKDLIPWTLETDQGTELKIRPKVRIGGAHETQFTTVSADIDITENQPLKYGAPSRYIGIGGEVRAWEHAAFRLGYRANLSVEDSGVLTTGLGLTPFGVGLDVSVWGKPGELDEATTLIKDIGFVMQLSANF